MDTHLLLCLFKNPMHAHSGGILVLSSTFNTAVFSLIHYDGFVWLHDLVLLGVFLPGCMVGSDWKVTFPHALEELFPEWLLLLFPQEDINQDIDLVHVIWPSTNLNVELLSIYHHGPCLSKNSGYMELECKSDHLIIEDNNHFHSYALIISLIKNLATQEDYSFPLQSKE
ncbi:hypothetical protein VNO78_15873 [Psophocarpus tetragonolobus]|uniref:Uncharacterized protein n=1 Tax=Psophocarpus tetragonolobus TaxID=3891 RepID=A0AAN9XJJ8_PSOTE